MKHSRSRIGRVKAPSNDKKTKPQLQEELIEVQDTLKKREAEITECRRKLQQAQDELGSLEELQVKLNLAEDAEKKLRASEKLEHRLQERILELEKIIEILKGKFEAAEHWDKAISKDILSPKASYRIDLYRHQGQYQGKIEHILTKDKKAFAGLDGTAIIEFMSRHLPQVEEKVEKIEHHVAQPIPSGETSEESVEFKSISEPLQRLSDLRIIPVGADSPITTLSQNTMFEVHINVNFAGVVMPDEEPIEKILTIYAKRLGGTHEIVGKTHIVHTSTAESTFKMIGKSLPVGAYRLEASLTFSRPTGEPARLPNGFFLKGSMLNVY